MEIRIERLTPARADDFFRFFEKEAYPEHPEWGCECYCGFFHAASAEEWKAVTAGQNRAQTAERIAAGEMRGLLAYAGARPVGWCHFDRREALPGLKIFYPQAVLEEERRDIGSIVCFTVAQDCRRQGVAGRLLGEACGELRGMGLKVAEGYPQTAEIVGEEKAGPDERQYRGPLALYLSQGFGIYRRLPSQAVVRRAL
jgi:GNAT superfamily N-acetyltransferase